MDIFNRSGPKSPRGWQSKAAFSLVEVTLAVGIFGFAFTMIVGLIPAGLITFRQAMDASVTSQICQRVINDAQQTDFDALTSGGNSTRYFDDQGYESATSTNAIYKVETSVTGSTQMPGNATTTNLATVKIAIKSNPGGVQISSYSGLVSRNK
jgi:uncharacterized protein (TIGR02598 family)